MHLRVARMLCGAMLFLFTTGCSLSAAAPTTSATTSAEPSATPVVMASATVTSAATPAIVPTVTFTHSPSPVPTVESLNATVNADRLSCRYGPGPDYLYLYGLRKGAHIILVGRTDADNWHWVYVQGRSPCWVNATFLDIQGSWTALPVVYPGTARLPVSPYYPPTAVLSVVRRGDEVTVEWLDRPLHAGDEEDASMQHYIAEIWHCQDGRILFDPLATNELSVTFIDQAGCTTPSHGRIFVQEKHGFAGPADIPWPAP